MYIILCFLYIDTCGLVVVNILVNKYLTIKLLGIYF